MLRTFLIPLVAWDFMFYGLVSVYLWRERTGPGLPEYFPIWAATFLLGVIVVILSSKVCPRLRRPLAALVGLAIGAGASALGGWLWSVLADAGSVLLPGFLWVLGLMLAIPSGIAGAVVGLLQSAKSGG